MKQKLSITIDEMTVKIIENRIKDGRFRNKSHLIEYALNHYLRCKNG